MYDELISSLRICGDSVDAIDECCYEDCIYHESPINPLCMQVLCNKAADAIEKLQKAVNFHKFNSEFWEDKYNSLADEKRIPVTEENDGEV